MVLTNALHIGPAGFACEWSLDLLFLGFLLLTI